MDGLERERRWLQYTVAVLGVVPVTAGLAGALAGTAMVENGATISADSHFRYLSGLLFGIGLCFWSTIPNIEDQTRRFRLLTLLVLVGGLGRLFGLLLGTVPPLPMLGALVMELAVTPALCLWQARIANRYAAEPVATSLSK